MRNLALLTVLVFSCPAHAALIVDRFEATYTGAVGIPDLSDNVEHQVVQDSTNVAQVDISHPFLTVGNGSDEAAVWGSAKIPLQHLGSYIIASSFLLVGSQASTDASSAASRYEIDLFFTADSPFRYVARLLSGSAMRIDQGEVSMSLSRGDESIVDSVFDSPVTGNGYALDAGGLLEPGDYHMTFSVSSYSHGDGTAVTFAPMSFWVTAASVPEPSLLALGMLGLLFRRRSRR